MLPEKAALLVDGGGWQAREGLSPRPLSSERFGGSGERRARKQTVMSITEQQVNDFASAMQEIHSRILLSDIPDDAAYRGYLDKDTPFALDRHGYRVSYLGLLSKVFALPRIADLWSEDGIQELGHQLLLSLAQSRKDANIPDFPSIAREWLAKIDAPFEEFTCCTAAAGLSVDAPLEIGDVTFLPLEMDLPEFRDEAADSFRENLNTYRDCLSSSKVSAEWRRASEIHCQKTEYALNVIRFIASLVWHDQKTRHVYIASQDPMRISEMLVVAPAGAVSRVGASDFTPLPVNLDQETLPYAQFYGLGEIQVLLRNPSPAELQGSYLTSIQWFGRATQELLPLVAFVKYYISIKAALKKEGESAKQVIPRRLGVLIEPWDKSRLARLETDLRDLIDERNAVFHSGSPLTSTLERLEWDARILSRQALHQLRVRLRSEGWQTKDDLIAWVSAQHAKHLS